VLFYNDSGIVSSSITANYGLINDQDKIMEAKYNVVVINEKGEKVKNPYYSRDCNFGTIQITKEGYELLDNLKLIDEDGRFIS
jgi:hypothetical protein